MIPKIKVKKPADKQSPVMQLLGVCLHDIMVLEKRTTDLENIIDKLTETPEPPDMMYE